LDLFSVIDKEREPIIGVSTPKVKGEEGAKKFGMLHKF
jgi:hypothetical protein